MRTILIAAATAVVMAAPASAQVAGHGAGQGVRAGGGWTGGTPGNAGNWRGRSGQGGQWHGGGRWGRTVDGRWWGGARAPGGWAAYRRPSRGWQMPGYWRSPDWAIGDWQAYGLQPPPAGYGWSRYYDDAVLADAQGYVGDSVDGIDWARGEDRYGYPDYEYDDRGYDDRGYDDRDYDDRYYEDRGYDRLGYYDGRDARCYHTGRRRDRSGIGGALVGGAIGAGIGAVTGGLGAILLGGGLGALGGQAIDLDSSRRGRVVCDPPGYGAWHGDYGYGAHGGGPVATVTVEFDAPVTTTTTTTTTEQWVYPRRAARRPVRKSKLLCRC